MNQRLAQDPSRRFSTELAPVRTFAAAMISISQASKTWTWNMVAKAGEPTETILRTASELSADLIVMTTDGPDGFLDALRGSTSERVLRKARCPVANLPAGSLLG
jgi:nucleotide-binding universal stress UspA family protein